MDVDGLTNGSLIIVAYLSLCLSSVSLFQLSLVRPSSCASRAVCPLLPSPFSSSSSCCWAAVAMRPTFRKTPRQSSRSGCTTGCRRRGAVTRTSSSPRWAWQWHWAWWSWGPGGPRWRRSARRWASASCQQVRDAGGLPGAADLSPGAPNQLSTGITGGGAVPGGIIKSNESDGTWPLISTTGRGKSYSVRGISYIYKSPYMCRYFWFILCIFVFMRCEE